MRSSGGAGMGYSTTSNGSGGGGNARSQVMPNASNNRLSTVIGGRLRMRAGAGVITDKHPRITADPVARQRTYSGWCAILGLNQFQIEAAILGVTCTVGI